MIGGRRCPVVWLAAGAVLVLVNGAGGKSEDTTVEAPSHRMLDMPSAAYEEQNTDTIANNERRWLQDDTELTPSPVPQPDPTSGSSDSNGAVASDDSLASGDDNEVNPTTSEGDDGPSVVTPSPTSGATTKPSVQPSTADDGGGSVGDGDVAAPTTAPAVTPTGSAPSSQPVPDSDENITTPTAPPATAATAQPSSPQSTPVPQTAPVPAPTGSPALLDNDNDGGNGGVAPTVQPVTSSTLTFSPSTVLPTDAPPIAGGGGGTEATDEPSASLQPTPAPIVEGEVGRLHASISAPSTALGTPSSAGTLSNALVDLVKNDDQDIISVSIAGSTRSSSRRLLWGEAEQGARGFEDPHEERTARGKSGGDTPSVNVIEDEHRDRLVWSFARRTLVEQTTADVTMTFINDQGETDAYTRGAVAAVTLLEGRGDLAAALNVTEDEVIIDDVVYSTPTLYAINTEEALNTFAESGGPATGAAIAIAAAVILAAVVATACIGVACGKCWLHKERKRRGALKTRESPKPAYERPRSRSPGDSEGGAGSHAPLNTNGIGNSSSALENARNNGFGGRLAPTVSVGGLLIHETAGVPARGGQNRFLYDPENGSHVRGNVLRTVSAVGEAAAGAAGERNGNGHAGEEELLEHDYGDAGRTESFVDGVDGTYSEFGVQSEYDAVVPGGSVNDGNLSDGGSSRCYYDDAQSSEWGTDIGTQHGHDSFAAFPLQKGASSRFSAGPRSQASFAAPSVAASGRSVQSSILPSSRANFPPPSGGGVSPLFSGPRPFPLDGAGDGVGKGGCVEVGEVNALVYGKRGQDIKAEEMTGNGKGGGVLGTVGIEDLALAGRSMGCADDVETGVGDDQTGPSARSAAASEIGAAATDGASSGKLARPSLDSAAGSVVASSLVVAPRCANRNSSGCAGIDLREATNVLESAAIGGTGDGVPGGDMVDGNRKVSVLDLNDDDAASQYAGSCVNQQQQQAGLPRGANNSSFRAAGAGTRQEAGGPIRPPRFGGIAGGPTGRNSQPVAGMAGAESSYGGSENESFVSRVGSYALTDIGVGVSAVPATSRPGNGRAQSSPTSTVLRSNTGMSELASEHDSGYGSDGYTNASDSPGAQSGWERAWMRQRDDAMHFGGQ